jgi:hypothetical protein
MHGTAAAGNWGTVYAKNATVQYQGTAETSFQFVVDKFTTGGTTSTHIIFDNNFLVESPTQIKLVE